MRIITLFLSLFIFQSTCFGQLSKEVFFNYSSENSSFPDGHMMENFSEQENGIVWMGSRNGLYRFDGYNFKNFNKNIFDSASVLSNHISCQYLEGNLLYAGTYNAGLFVLDLKTLKAKHIFLPDSSLKSKYMVQFIYADSEDSLWIGTNKEAIIKMHKTNYGKRVFTLRNSNKEPLITSPNFTKLLPAIHQKNSFWALEENSIWLINRSSGEYKKYFNSDLINIPGLKYEPELTDLHIASDSIAWISSFNNGLYKWNYVTNKVEHFYPDNFKKQERIIGFNNMVPKSDTALFISSSGHGLLVFNTQTKSFDKYENKPGQNLSIHEGACRRVFKDTKGAIWLSFINAVSYRHPDYQHINKIKLPPIYDKVRVPFLHKINRDKLFVSLENYRGSLLFDIKTKEWSKLSSFLNDEAAPVNNPVYYIFKINNQNLFKPNALPFQSLANDYSKFILFKDLPDIGFINAYEINGISETENIIVCTGKEAVLIFNKEKNQWQLHKNANHNDSLHTKKYNTPIADKFGDVWLKSDQDGLSVYNADKHVFKEISYRIKKEYEGLQFITKMLLNKDGTKAFVSTRENGIFVFSTETKELINHYNADNLLPQNEVYNMALSNADIMLWVAAHQSITRINLKTKETKTYDDKNSILQLKQGYMGFTVDEEGQAFVADTVLYTFFVNENSNLKLSPFVSSYRIHNNWYPGAEKIQLPKENSFVELLISTGNYADKAHEKIYYSIDGANDWNEAENGKIILTSLKNGITTLKIKAVNNGIIAAEGMTTLKINRAKYIYQTWWFALVAILLTAGLLLYLFKRKIKTVRLREREKAENEIKMSELEMASLRSQMNPHFLFNSLSSLRYLVMTNDSKKATKFIVKLSKLLRRILNHSQEQTILLQDELEALELYLEIESLRFENGFTYTIDVAEVDNLFHIKIPPLLLQPIVENAIKHGLVNSESAEKWVQIKVVQLPNESIEITIADNGIGRNKAAGLKKYNAANSMGNSLTAQRILLFNKTHKAKLSCMVNDLTADKENPGTEVKIIYRETV